MKIERIPAILYAGMLFALSYLVSGFNLPRSFVFFGFILIDWLLIGLLPVFKRSFGPVKPPVLALAVLRIPFTFIPGAMGILIQSLGTILVLYGFYFEPLRLKVTSQSLISSKLKSDNPIRMLQISDLHLERITERERQLNKIIKNLHPDLILFTGDFLNISYLDDPTALSQVREVISEWSAPFGVYAVSGSPAVDLPELMPKILDGMNIRRLDNECLPLDIHGSQLDLIGLTCSHKPFMDITSLNTVLESSHPAWFKLFLYHTPDLAPDAAEIGIDLMLSGHTHGGQVRLPVFGALFSGSLYGRKFQSGPYPIGDMLLYISRGLGMEGLAAPRVRFLCQPELVLWQLDGKPTTFD